MYDRVQGRSCLCDVSSSSRGASHQHTCDAVLITNLMDLDRNDIGHGWLGRLIDKHAWIPL